jgi:hypothetical protein
MKLSPNFTLDEFTVSQAAIRKGLRNEPNATHIEALRLLCTNVLEPLRARLHQPIVISSGFRSPLVNRIVGGSDRSQHTRGEAADIIVPGVPVADVIGIVRKLKLPVDQCIDEFGRWVHISHAANGQQRGEYLIARREGGGVCYKPWG